MTVLPGPWAADEAPGPTCNMGPREDQPADDAPVLRERVRLLERLVDQLEGELASTGAELADTKHQLEQLRLSACRLAADTGVRQ